MGSVETPTLRKGKAMRMRIKIGKKVPMKN